MNLPDWLMIKVLPIAIIVLAELWWILRLRKDRKRLKDELEKERKDFPCTNCANVDPKHPDHCEFAFVEYNRGQSIWDCLGAK